MNLKESEQTVFRLYDSDSIRLYCMVCRPALFGSLGLGGSGIALAQGQPHPQLGANEFRKMMSPIVSLIQVMESSKWLQLASRGIFS